MKLGTRVKITAGLFEGLFGVIADDDDEDGPADIGKLCVAVEINGERVTTYVPTANLIDQSNVIPRVVEIEAAVRDAVGRRGINQRALEWWAARAASTETGDLDALDRAEASFRVELEAERAVEEQAALAEVHASFEGLDESEREVVWQLYRGEWTAWRGMAPASEWTNEQLDAGSSLRSKVELHRRARALSDDGAALRSNEALEALIEAEPEADPPRLVYADWLHEVGDPRGELMQREARGETVARAPFLGSLAVLERDLAATWRLGFLESVRVEVNRADERAGMSLSQLLERVLALPTARVLRELTVYLPSVHEDREDVVAVLTARPRPTLRRLMLTTNEEEEMLSWTGVGDLGQLAAALPALEELSVRAGSFAFSTADFPSLTRLSIETCRMEAAHLATIAAARWPRLESLTLWCGSESYGVEVRADDFAELLTRCELPSLRALDLSNNEVSDALVERVLASPLLAQLESLTLSKGTMTAAGARLLVDNAAQLAHLKLDLTENYLDDESVAALEEALPRARLDDQREAEEYQGTLYRYAAVGE